ncbi:hypothetical protein ACQZV8_20445 [Magnetococcales bacterium HHB-1]
MSLEPDPETLEQLRQIMPYGDMVLDQFKKKITQKLGDAGAEKFINWFGRLKEKVPLLKAPEKSAPEEKKELEALILEGKEAGHIEALQSLSVNIFIQENNRGQVIGHVDKIENQTFNF